MRFNHLDDWLSWQETLHPEEIELGLERVALVLDRAGLSPAPDCPVIMVAGTNGKGSVVAMLEAIAAAAGLKVASYTSPHLFKYNERIRINQCPVTDEVLCEAFERIDQARHSGSDDVALTYFEFGTLAAIDIFSRCEPDLMILEVGLGGRLDAVNIMQPSVSVITTVGIDHVDWLGDDREKIGREKAGILRTATPAVCGDRQLPASVYEVAATIGTELKVIGRDFSVRAQGNLWDLDCEQRNIEALVMPSLSGAFQLDNAATAIMALLALEQAASKLSGKFTRQVISQGLQHCQLSGRFQTLGNKPLLKVDVAHNPEAARALYSQLSEVMKTRSAGRCFAVLAMLADKDVEQVVEILSPIIDVWYCAGLHEAQRGLDETQLLKRVREQVTSAKLCSAENVASACKLAMTEAGEDDCIIVFGSFYTAAAAISYFSHPMRSVHSQ